jgi:protein-disulfide isomerase
MSRSPGKPSLVLPIEPRDHCLGSPSARLSIVEYSDFESPACGLAHWVLKELLRELADDVCIVFRNYPPTKDHPRARDAAEAAEAADAQGKFWLMHDRLFEHQDRLDPEHLREYARGISLDMATFERDLRSGAPAKRVVEDIESGNAYHVRQTPTFFLNGRLYPGPAEFLPMLAVLQGEKGGRE